MRALILCVLLCACSQRGYHGADVVDAKSLHSVWTSTHDPNWVMDLSHQDEITFEYWTGGYCHGASGFSWMDYETKGWLSVEPMTDQNITADDPTCAQFVGTWTYELKLSGILRICPSSFAGSCVEFR